jgi:hypothetical protein
MAVMALFALVLLSTCELFSVGLGTKVDLEPPVVTITSPTANDYLGSGSGFTVTGTAADDIGIVSLKARIRKDDGSFIIRDITPRADGTWSVDFDVARNLAASNPVPDGERTIEIVARDAKGWETIRSIVVFVDTKNPTVLVTVPVSYDGNAESIVTSTYISVKGESWDATGVESVQVSIYDGIDISSEPLLTKTADGTATWGVRFIYGLDIPAVDGLYSFSVVATDKAGNASEVFYHVNDFWDHWEPAFAGSPLPAIDAIGRLDQQGTDVDGLDSSVLETHRLDTIGFVIDIDTNKPTITFTNINPDAPVLENVVPAQVPVTGFIQDDEEGLKLSAIRAELYDLQENKVLVAALAPSRLVAIGSGLTVNFEFSLLYDDGFLSNGRYRITVYAEDNNGAWRTISAGFIIDSTRPVITEIIPQTESFVTLQDGNVIVSAQIVDDNPLPESSPPIVQLVNQLGLVIAPAADNTKSMVFDSNAGTWIGALQVPIGSADIYVKITAQDDSGKVSTTPTPLHYYIDIGLPEITIERPLQGSSVEGDAMAASGEAVDPDGSGVRYVKWYLASNLNGDATAPESGSIEWQDAALAKTGTITVWSATSAFPEGKEGTFSLFVKSIDLAGNESEIERSDFAYDRANPEISLFSLDGSDFPVGINYRTNPFVLGLSVQDSNGLASISVEQKLNTAVQEVYRRNFTSTTTHSTIASTPSELASLPWSNSGNFVDGIYEYTLRVVDIAGKISVISRTVTADQTPPSITFTSLSPLVGENTVNGVITFRATVSDENGLIGTKWAVLPATEDMPTYETALNSFVSTPYNAVIDTTTLVNMTEYKIWMVAKDRAGNESAQAYPVFVDQASDRPVLVLTNMNAGYTTAESAYGNLQESGAKLTGTITDDDGVDGSSIRIAINGQASVPIGVITAQGTGFSIQHDLSGLAEGIHYFTLTYADVLGLAADPVTVYFVVDKNAPTATVSSPSEGSYQKGNFTLSGTAGDANGFHATTPIVATVSKDNGVPAAVTLGGTTAAWTIAGNGLLDGKYVYSVTVMDRFGKTTTVTRTVNVDKTAPVVGITTPVADSWNRGTTMTATGSVAEDNGIVSVQWSTNSTDGSNGTWNAVSSGTTSWSATVELSDLGEGPGKTLWVRSTDTAGNTGTTSRLFGIDQADPVTSFTAPSGASAAFAITGTATDSNSVSKIVITQIKDGDTANPIVITINSLNAPSHFWTTDAVLPLASDGETAVETGVYSYIFAVTDVAGNTTSYGTFTQPNPAMTAAHNVSIDLTKPTSTISDPNNDAAQLFGNSYTIRGTASDIGPSGLVKVQYSMKKGEEAFGQWIDASGLGTWTVNLDLLGLGEGAFIIRSQAIDGAGNIQEPPAVRTFYIDQSAPTVTETFVSETGLQTKTAFYLEGVAEDSNALASISIRQKKDNGDFVVLPSPPVVTGTSASWSYGEVVEGIGTALPRDPDSPANHALADGRYLYEIIVRDAANRQMLIERVVILDRTAPTVEVTSLSQNAVVSNASLSLAGKASDGTGSGVARVEYTLSYSDDSNDVWEEVEGTNNWNTLLDLGAEGPKTLSVRAKDNLENYSDVLSISFSLDLAPPTLTETEVRAGTQRRSDDFILSGTASDTNGLKTWDHDEDPLTPEVPYVEISVGGGAVYELTVDTANGNTWTYLYLVGTTNADVSFQITATDVVGNATTLNRLVTVDTSPPTIVIDGVLSGLNRTVDKLNGLITFRFSAADSGVGVERNGGTYEAYYTVLQSDATPSLTAAALLNWTKVESTTTNFLIQNLDTRLVDGSDSDPVISGTRNLWIGVRDAVTGNPNFSTEKYLLKIDQESDRPIITIDNLIVSEGVTHSQNVLGQNPAILVTIEDDDSVDVSSLQYRIGDSGNWVAFEDKPEANKSLVQAKILLTGLPQGLFTIQLRAKDYLSTPSDWTWDGEGGIFEDDAVYSWQATPVIPFAIDFGPPTLILSAPVSGAYNTDLGIAGTATDSLGVVNIKYSFDNGQNYTNLYNNPTGTATVTLPAEGFPQKISTESLVTGEYTLTVMATDRSGYTSSQQIPITVDKDKPSVSFLAPGANAVLNGNQIRISGEAFDNRQVGAVFLWYGLASIDPSTLTMPSRNSDGTYNPGDFTRMFGTGVWSTTPPAGSPEEPRHIDTTMAGIPVAEGGAGPEDYRIRAIPIDSIGNIGDPKDILVTIDQNSDRPEISLSNMAFGASDNRVGEGGRISGVVEDDDGVKLGGDFPGIQIRVDWNGDGDYNDGTFGNPDYEGWIHVSSTGSSDALFTTWYHLVPSSATEGLKKFQIRALDIRASAQNQTEFYAYSNSLTSSFNYTVSEEVSFFVDYGPPALNISAPASNARLNSNSVTVTGTAQDGTGVQKVSIWVDDNNNTIINTTGGEWDDFFHPIDDPRHGNGRVDNGEWTDTNGDGIVNAGELTVLVGKLLVNIDTGSNLISTTVDHGLSANDVVYLSGSPRPIGITSGTRYYVRSTNLTTRDFELSSAAGDFDIINFSDTGTTVSIYGQESWPLLAGPGTYNLNHTVSGLSDGTKNIQIKAYDASYASATRDLSVTIDTEAPTALIDAPVTARVLAGSLTIGEWYRIVELGTDPDIHLTNAGASVSPAVGEIFQATSVGSGIAGLYLVPTVNGILRFNGTAEDSAGAGGMVTKVEYSIEQSGSEDGVYDQPGEKDWTLFGTQTNVWSLNLDTRTLTDNTSYILKVRVTDWAGNVSTPTAPDTIRAIRVNQDSDRPRIQMTSLIVGGTLQENLLPGDKKISGTVEDDDRVKGSSIQVAIMEAIPATSIVSGKTYQIRSLGDTPWNSIGASASPAVGEWFLATGSGSGNGTVVRRPDESGDWTQVNAALGDGRFISWSYIVPKNDGTYYLWVRAYDENSSAYKTFGIDNINYGSENRFQEYLSNSGDRKNDPVVFAIDTANPTLTVAGPPQNFYTNGQGVTYAVTGVPGESNSYFTVASNFGLSAGDTVYFSGTTLPNGLSAGTPYYVLPSNLDDERFEVSDILNGDKVTFSTAGTNVRVTSQFNTPAIHFYGTATDGSGLDDTIPVIVRYRIQDGTWVEPSLDVTYSSATGHWSATLETSALPELAEGVYDWQVIATDAFGKTSIAERLFIVDKTAPAITITNPGVDAVVNGSLFIDGTVTDKWKGNLDGFQVSSLRIWIGQWTGDPLTSPTTPPIQAFYTRNDLDNPVHSAMHWKELTGTSGWNYRFNTTTIVVDDGDFVPGYVYEVSSIGTGTNWAAIGAGASPPVGAVFTAIASGTGSGTGQARLYAGTLSIFVAAIDNSGNVSSYQEVRFETNQADNKPRVVMTSLLPGYYGGTIAADPAATTTSIYDAALATADNTKDWYIRFRSTGYIRKVDEFTVVNVAGTNYGKVEFLPRLEVAPSGGYDIFPNMLGLPSSAEGQVTDNISVNRNSIKIAVDANGDGEFAGDDEVFVPIVNTTVSGGTINFTYDIGGRYSEGTTLYRLKIQASDNGDLANGVGVVTTTTSEYFFVRDDAAPGAATLTEFSNGVETKDASAGIVGSNFKDYLSLKGTATDVVGVANVEVAIGNATNFASEIPLPFTAATVYNRDSASATWEFLNTNVGALSTPSQITVRVRITDMVGRQTTESFTFNVDKTGPTVSVEESLDGSIVDGSLYLSGVAGDTYRISRVYLWIGDGAGLPTPALPEFNFNTLAWVNPSSLWMLATDTTAWNYRFNTTTRDNGPKTVKVVAFDNAGNISAVSTIGLTFDQGRNRPIIDVTGLRFSRIIGTMGSATTTSFTDPKLKDNLDVKIGWTVAFPDSSVKTVTAFNSGTGTVSWSGAVSFPSGSSYTLEAPWYTINTASTNVITVDALKDASRGAVPAPVAGQVALVEESEGVHITYRISAFNGTTGAITLVSVPSGITPASTRVKVLPMTLFGANASLSGLVTDEDNVTGTSLMYAIDLNNDGLYTGVGEAYQSLGATGLATVISFFKNLDTLAQSTTVYKIKVKAADVAAHGLPAIEYETAEFLIAKDDSVPNDPALTSFGNGFLTKTSDIDNSWFKDRLILGGTASDGVRVSAVDVRLDLNNDGDFDDAGEGWNAVDVFVPAASVNWTIDLSSLNPTPGNIPTQVRVTDYWGRQTSRNFTFKADTLAPVISPVDPATVLNGTFRFSGTASDANSAVNRLYVWHGTDAVPAFDPPGTFAAGHWTTTHGWTTSGLGGSLTAWNYDLNTVAIHNLGSDLAYNLGFVAVDEAGNSHRIDLAETINQEADRPAISFSNMTMGGHFGTIDSSTTTSFTDDALSDKTIDTNWYVRFVSSGSIRRVSAFSGTTVTLSSALPLAPSGDYVLFRNRFDSPPQLIGTARDDDGVKASLVQISLNGGAYTTVSEPPSLDGTPGGTVTWSHAFPGLTEGIHYFNVIVGDKDAPAFTSRGDSFKWEQSDGDLATGWQNAPTWFAYDSAAPVIDFSRLVMFDRDGGLYNPALVKTDGGFVEGNAYRILDLGVGTDWHSLGADATPAVGEWFIATATGTTPVAGSGTALLATTNITSEVAMASRVVNNDWYLTGSVTDGSLASAEYQIDGGAWTALSIDGSSFNQLFNWRTNPLSDGAHTVTIRGTDSFGKATTKSLTIFLDITRPTITVSSPAVTGTSLVDAVNGTVYLSGTFSEAATVSYAVGKGFDKQPASVGTPQIAWNYSFDSAVLRNSTHDGSGTDSDYWIGDDNSNNVEDGEEIWVYKSVLRIQAVDAAGNVTRIDYDFTIDNNTDRPTTTVVFPGDGATAAGEITINGTTSDDNQPDDGVAAVYIRVDVNGDGAFADDRTVEGTSRVSGTVTSSTLLSVTDTGLVDMTGKIQANRWVIRFTGPAGSPWLNETRLVSAYDAGTKTVSWAANPVYHTGYALTAPLDGATFVVEELYKNEATWIPVSSLSGGVVWQAIINAYGELNASSTGFSGMIKLQSRAIDRHWTVGAPSLPRTIFIDEQSPSVSVGTVNGRPFIAGLSTLVRGNAVPVSALFMDDQYLDPASRIRINYNSTTLSSTTFTALASNQLYDWTTIASIGADSIDIANDTITADLPVTVDNGTKVIFKGSAPGGLTAGTAYFVINNTGDQFQLAAVSGGSAVNITSANGSYTLAWPGSRLLLRAAGAAVTTGTASAESTISLTGSALNGLVGVVGKLVYIGSSHARIITDYDDGTDTIFWADAITGLTGNQNFAITTAFTVDTTVHYAGSAGYLDVRFRAIDQSNQSATLTVELAVDNQRPSGVFNRFPGNNPPLSPQGPLTYTGGDWVTGLYTFKGNDGTANLLVGSVTDSGDPNGVRAVNIYFVKDTNKDGVYDAGDEFWNPRFNQTSAPIGTLTEIHPSGGAVATGIPYPSTALDSYIITVDKRTENMIYDKNPDFGDDDGFQESLLDKSGYDEWKVLFDTTKLPDGPMWMFLVYEDAAGNRSFQRVNVQMSNYPPSISSVKVGSSTLNDTNTRIKAGGPDGTTVTFRINAVDDLGADTGLNLSSFRIVAAAKYDYAAGDIGAQDTGFTPIVYDSGYVTVPNEGDPVEAYAEIDIPLTMDGGYVDNKWYRFDASVRDKDGNIATRSFHILIEIDDADVPVVTIDDFGHVRHAGSSGHIEEAVYLTFTASESTVNKDNDRFLVTLPTNVPEGFPVRFAGSDLPHPLTAGTTYYVKNRTSSSFQVILDIGQNAVDLGSTGSGKIQVIDASRTKAALSGTVQITGTATDGKQVDTVVIEYYDGSNWQHIESVTPIKDEALSTLFAQYYTWSSAWNTATISTVAKENLKIRAYGQDGIYNMDVSTTGDPSDPAPISGDSKIVDVVPYIREIILQGMEDSRFAEIRRSVMGKYHVAVGSTVTVNGFNLPGTTPGAIAVGPSTTTASSASGNTSLTVMLDMLSSGNLVITTAGVPSGNHQNSNMLAQNLSNTTVRTGYTDDCYISFWNLKTLAATNVTDAVMRPSNNRASMNWMFVLNGVDIYYNTISASTKLAYSFQVRNPDLTYTTTGTPLWIFLNDSNSNNALPAVNWNVHGGVLWGRGEVAYDPANEKNYAMNWNENVYPTIGVGNLSFEGSTRYTGTGSTYNVTGNAQMSRYQNLRILSNGNDATNQNYVFYFDNRSSPEAQNTRSIVYYSFFANTGAAGTQTNTVGTIWRTDLEQLVSSTNQFNYNPGKNATGIQTPGGRINLTSNGADSAMFAPAYDAVNNRLFLVYYDEVAQTLKYMYRLNPGSTAETTVRVNPRTGTTEGWVGPIVIENVNAVSGLYPAITVRNNAGKSEVHITYMNKTSSLLKYAYLSDYNATPVIYTIDGTNATGYNNSITVARFGNDDYRPVISTYSSSFSGSRSSVKVLYPSASGAISDGYSSLVKQYTLSWEVVHIPASTDPKQEPTFMEWTGSGHELPNRLVVGYNGTAPQEATFLDLVLTP